MTTRPLSPAPLRFTPERVAHLRERVKSFVQLFAAIVFAAAVMWLLNFWLAPPVLEDVASPQRAAPEVLRPTDLPAQPVVPQQQT